MKSNKTKYLVVIVMGVFFLLNITACDKSQAESKDSKAQATDKKDNKKAKGAKAEFSKENYNKVKVGMTKEQVKSILGTTEDIDESEVGDMKVEVWNYQSSSEYCQIDFQNGKVMSKSITKM